MSLTTVTADNVPLWITLIIYLSCRQFTHIQFLVIIEYITN